MGPTKYLFKKPDGKGGWKYFYKDNEKIKIHSGGEENIFKKYFSKGISLNFNKAIISGKAQRNTVLFENEQGLRGKLEKEKCGFFDKEGNLIFSKEGDFDKIEFEHHELNKIRNCEILTHNHPENKSFSLEDFLFCFISGVRQIKAVHGGTTYLLEMSQKDNGTPDLDRIKSVVESIVANSRDAKEAVDAGIKYNIISKEKGDEIYFDELWRRVAQDNKLRGFMGIRYEVKKDG